MKAMDVEVENDPFETRRKGTRSLDAQGVDPKAEAKLVELLLGENNDAGPGDTRDRLVRKLRSLADWMENREDRGARRERKKGRKRRCTGEIDVQNYNSRHVALEIAYFGWEYRGFASQKHVDDTVEQRLFDALRRTRLIHPKAQPEDLGYGRCGRTDKGVSALGQVVNLRLRSKAKKGAATLPVEEELDYMKMINKALPDDIRVLGWADVEDGFHARFKARGRRYKYYFAASLNLDLDEMAKAAEYFQGEHDFRNFCRMDALNVHCFKRRIRRCRICPVAGMCSDGDEPPLYFIDVVGSSFLWHQVRCMAAVLFMVGRRQERPEIVRDLLDVDCYPRKPQYAMAPDLPLQLFSCDFDQLCFQRSVPGVESAISHVENLIDIERIKLQGMRSLRKKLGRFDGPSGRVSEGRHIPLSQRPTEKSYEERRTRIAHKMHSIES